MTAHHFRSAESQSMSLRYLQSHLRKAVSLVCVWSNSYYSRLIWVCCSSTVRMSGIALGMKYATKWQITFISLE